MDRTVFETDLKNAGYEVGTSKAAADTVTSPHAHAFDVRALVVSGEVTLDVGGTSATYRAGDVFEMAAGCVHSERHGPDGSESVVGRRPKPAGA